MNKAVSAKPVLNNIRILDFTWVLAGPYATRLLADFGAEVIKVQPLLSTEDDDSFARGYYNTWNRNKLGVTLNLNKPGGIGLAKKLVAVCDAVVENFTPRVMANWGLDYAGLKEIKPDIIMVSLSAMGWQSPQRDYTGYGPTVHALSGLTRLMSLDGRPIGPGFSYADHVAGLYAAVSLLGALEHRRRTGEGQHMDMSETDLMAGLLKEKDPPKAPDGIYPCWGENRWCAVTVNTEEEWRGLKRALGNPAWAEDAGYADAESRLANQRELDGRIEAWTRERTAEEVVSVLRQNGVAAGIVHDAAALARDPQLEARGFFLKGEMPFTDASPVRMDSSGAAYKRAAPAAGRDNDYVYGTLLGLGKEEMADLKKKGVI